MTAKRKKDLLDMRPDGVPGDAERGRYLGVRAPFREKHRDLGLTAAEPEPRAKRLFIRHRGIQADGDDSHWGKSRETQWLRGHEESVHLSLLGFSDGQRRQRHPLNVRGVRYRKQCGRVGIHVNRIPVFVADDDTVARFVSDRFRQLEPGRDIGFAMICAWHTKLERKQCSFFPWKKIGQMYRCLPGFRRDRLALPTDHTSGGDPDYDQNFHNECCTRSDCCPELMR